MYISTNYNTSSIYNAQNSLNLGKMSISSDTTTTSNSRTSVGDTASFSSESLAMLRQMKQTQGNEQPPQKPEDMDFSSMSDDEVKSFLSNMQSKDGTLPSEFGDITSVSDMTSEQIQSARETLTSKQEEMKAGGGQPPAGGPGGAPPSGGAGGAGGIGATEDDEDDEDTVLEQLMEALEEADKKKKEDEESYQKKMQANPNSNAASMMQMFKNSKIDFGAEE